MTDAAPPTVPPLVRTLALDFAQKGWTAAAAMLLAHGFLDGAGEPQFIQLAVSGTMLLVSCLWTVLAAHARRDHETALLNTPPPSPPAAP